MLFRSDGDNTPIIRGSALGALNGEPQWEEKVIELMDAVDNWIPLPPRDIDKPFLMPNKSQQYGRPIWLLADEPYRFLAYDGAEVPSVLPLYPYAVAVSSLSKNLSLPGERVGYVALAPQMPEKAELMAALTFTNRILGFVNPPVIGQHIMAAALGSSVDRSIYAARRAAMAQVLTEAGYAFVMPRGAFYFFQIGRAHV